MSASAHHSCWWPLDDRRAGGKSLESERAPIAQEDGAASEGPAAASEDEKGMTHRDLAAAAKVTPGYIARLEMGLRKNPSLDMLKRLARALRVPVTERLE
jgi:DNA-binding XRE family transcriptional regulator